MAGMKSPLLSIHPNLHQTSSALHASIAAKLDMRSRTITKLLGTGLDGYSMEMVEAMGEVEAHEEDATVQAEGEARRLCMQVTQ